MSNPKFKVGDKVRVLDGSKISGYAGGWSSSGMNKFVGKVFTVTECCPRIISYGYYYSLSIRETPAPIFDERGLELADDQTEKPRKIIVMQDKANPMRVIAKDLDTGKTAEARCNPSDAFDFYTGANLAMQRLAEKHEPEEPKYFTGKVVCVEAEFSEIWTVGKVYSVVNGEIVDDYGNRRGRFRSAEELSTRTNPNNKFIEYKGGA